MLFEAGRAGEAAIELAAQLADGERSTVTVVGVIPQAANGTRCGGSALEYNSMVLDQVTRELQGACDRLRIGDRAAFKLLVDGDDPALEAWSRTRGFDLILLPARRRPLRGASHPAAQALIGTGAEVRIVDPRAQRH